MGFFGAIWLALFGVAKISDAIEDAKEMAEPRFYSPETGKPIYIDRKGVYHGYGREKMKTNIYHDEYGNMHTQLVGRRTGTVYEDSGARQALRDSQFKMEAIQKGYGAYSKFHPKMRRCVACDIKTDKFIGAIEKDIDLYKSTATQKVYIYKKYFLERDACLPCLYDNNDFEFITEEEYESLRKSPSRTFSENDYSNNYKYDNGNWICKYGKLVKAKEDREIKNGDKVEKVEKGKYYLSYGLDKLNIPHT